ncbi:MAG: tetratricopeptide repeat protein [Myxococcota bacterium]
MLARGVALLVLAVALSGCPRGRVQLPHVKTSAKTVEETLADADALYGRRPDEDAVRESIAVYQSAAVADPSRVEGAIGVIRSVAWLLEHGAKKDRKTLEAEALAAGNQCQLRAPGTAQCNYWQAVARGIGAREHPSSGIGDLKNIIALLKKADAEAPMLEEAGPARVLALLLVRAPGWPVGPGDADAALVEAKKAVERAPSHPLNQIALAECLKATGDEEAARLAYQKAAELGRQRGDVDGLDFAQQAEKALEKLVQQ